MDGHLMNNDNISLLPICGKAKNTDIGTYRQNIVHMDLEYRGNFYGNPGFMIF